jgi:hemerythrin-like domain-containing protein
MNQKKMMPVAPLMIEHRRIERMIEVMRRHLAEVRDKQTVDHDLINQMVDFIRMYADRCHHGKEEDILFRDAEKKNLSHDHRRVLQELIDEHQWARGVTKALVEANDRHRQGDAGALETIVDSLKKLTGFYPDHIEKEDRHFFLPLMDYFSQEEQDAMLAEENEFDQGLIHEAYERMVAKNEKRFGV